jgi:hypothetical protein
VDWPALQENKKKAVALQNTTVMVAAHVPLAGVCDTTIPQTPAKGTQAAIISAVIPSPHKERAKK